jgi:hypothetical protein
MKIIASILIILSLMLNCDEKKTVMGFLQHFGSEPFPQLAIVTEEGGRFFLDLNEADYDKLMENRKEFLCVTGEVYEGEYLGDPHPFIKLEEWEWINKPDTKP